MKDIENKIKVKQLEIQIQQDPQKKIELNKQLRVLLLKQEIERIRIQISQIK
jgi:hypothetical protein